MNLWPPNVQFVFQRFFHRMSIKMTKYLDLRDHLSEILMRTVGQKLIFPPVGRHNIWAGKLELSYRFLCASYILQKLVS